jgi:hypothetical protein
VADVEQDRLQLSGRNQARDDGADLRNAIENGAEHSGEDDDFFVAGHVHARLRDQAVFTTSSLSAWAAATSSELRRTRM